MAHGERTRRNRRHALRTAASIVALLLAAVVVVSTANPDVTVPHGVQRDRSPHQQERDTARGASVQAAGRTVVSSLHLPAILPGLLAGLTTLLVTVLVVAGARSRAVARFGVGCSRAPPHARLVPVVA